MVKGICCYIDILGFKDFVKENTEGALYLLQNYQHQLQKVEENEHSMPIPYRRDSFKYLIPFSDSIFFYSENATHFVQQLSSFIHNSFSLTSNAFSRPENPNYPENVTEQGIEIENGKSVNKTYAAKWYPLLFRGGISFGNATVYELNSIQNSKVVKIPTILGTSVIESVKLEQSGLKGPRILCSKDFYEQIDSNAKKIVHPAFDKPDLYEVNWTAVHYLMTDEPNYWNVEQLLKNDFYSNLLIPAANLWRAYNHLPHALHYFNFLKLIVKGILHFFADTEYHEMVNIEVKRYLEDVNLSDKIHQLMK